MKNALTKIGVIGQGCRIIQLQEIEWIAVIKRTSLIAVCLLYDFKEMYIFTHHNHL